MTSLPLTFLGALVVKSLVGFKISPPMLRQIEGPSSRASQPRSHHVIVQILESKSPQTSIRALWLEIESQAVEAVVQNGIAIE
jgi:hypothetical protein